MSCAADSVSKPYADRAVRMTSPRGGVGGIRRRASHTDFENKINGVTNNSDPSRCRQKAVLRVIVLFVPVLQPSRIRAAYHLVC